jgi:hypothetical protein
MPEGARIISSAGIFADINWNSTPQDAIGSNISMGNPISVLQTIPNIFLEARQSCVIPYTAKTAFVGTLYAEVAVNAATAAVRDILYISAADGSAPVGFGVDATNHPTFKISAGTSTLVSFTGTSALVTGTRIALKLVWNALLGTFAFTINGQTPAGTYGATTSSPWAADTANTLSVCDGSVFTEAAYLGTLYRAVYAT